MPRPRTACSACAAIKTACSKDRPCSRCARLSLACDFRNGSVPRIASPRAIKESTLTRARHKNSSGGCTSCISRRKKCDEAFPVCGDCRRLGLLCLPRISHQHKLLPPGPLTIEQPRVATDAETLLEPCLGVVDKIPPSHDDAEGVAAFTGEYLEWVALLEENEISELARRGHLNSSSALASRQDGMPPPIRADAALQNFRMIDSQVVAGWHPTEQHLLSHFLQVVSRALVVAHDDDNPYLTEIVPMAFQNLSVRHALLALSARHLCRIYPVFEDSLIMQQSLALHFLKMELEKPIVTEYALAATLVMCLFEICQGNSRKWILHLYGAKALSNSLNGETPALCFLTDLYNHLCCMAIITSDKVPLVPHGPRLGAHSENGLSARQIHPILGLAGDIYNCLNSINQLSMHRMRGPQFSESQDGFESQALGIEMYLRQWRPPGGDTSNRYKEAASAADALRWGCIIWLHRIVSGGSASVHTRIEALDGILSAVSRVRPGSPFDAQLLFPLFMAGVSAILKTERLRVEHRLSVLEATVGTGNIAGAHRLLDHVWKRVIMDNEEVEWESLLRGEHGSVVLC